MRTPSNFCGYPWGSIFKKSECETIALNIMRILRRTGDEFRELSWEEYAKEREKDGAKRSSLHIERFSFNDVIPYCRNAKAAMSFSPEWAKVADQEKEL